MFRPVLEGLDGVRATLVYLGEVDMAFILVRSSEGKRG